MKKLTLEAFNVPEGDEFITPQERASIAKLAENKDFQVFRDVAEHIVIKSFIFAAKNVTNPKARNEMVAQSTGALNAWQELMKLVDEPDTTNETENEGTNE